MSFDLDWVQVDKIIAKTKRIIDGKRVTAVTMLPNGEDDKLVQDGPVYIYPHSLIIWFEDVPLIIDERTQFGAKPRFAQRRNDRQIDVTGIFAQFLGARLVKIGHVSVATCYFEFDNGYRIICLSRDEGNSKRLGSFEIRPIEPPPTFESLNIELICGPRCGFSPKHSFFYEDAIAFFCDDGAYLLYIENDEGRFETKPRSPLTLIRCSEELLVDYVRLYPLGKARTVNTLYKNGKLVAIRFDYEDLYLYIVKGGPLFFEIGTFREKLELNDDLLHAGDYLGSNSLGTHVEFLFRPLPYSHGVLPETNAQRIRLEKALEHLGHYMPITEEVRVHILSNLNTEKRMKSFLNWKEAQIYKDPPEITLEELCTAAWYENCF